MLTRPPFPLRVQPWLLALLCSTALPALAQDDPRIRAITLSSGGTAEVLREANVEGAATVQLRVPLAQVDDLLKSLVVQDPSGSVIGLTLDGQTPVEETFSRLPFSPQDLTSLPSLAASLQGVQVEASAGGRTVQGRVLGVEQVTQAGADGRPGTTEAWLSVITDNGQVQALRLGADATLDVRDAALRDGLIEAARVSGQSRVDGVRAVQVELAGEGARPVQLRYIVAAPVWKTAYRLVTEPGSDNARLQAWAVIENATADDWQDVNLTLASGAPVLLSQRLHDRYWAERPDVPVAVGAAAAPRADNEQAAKAESQRASGGASTIMRMAAPRPAAAPPPAPAPMADMSGMAAPQQAAAAQEGETAARYALPHPVTLAAGKTLSVPFLDQPLPVERLAVFQPHRGSTHPIAALFLRNTADVSLPPGLLTVFDSKDGHVGDVALAGLPAGESRLASFAEDRKVAITTETRPEAKITEIRVADGVLEAKRLSRQVTDYTVRGAVDGPRTVLIEHPRRSGWRFQSDALDSETPSLHRLRVQVGAGESVKVQAVAEREESEHLQLLHADPAILLSWSGNTADPATAQRLRQLAERRTALAQAQAQVAQVDAQLNDTIENQSRVRENLAAVPADSSLGQRYAKMLAEEEDRIATLQDTRRKAQADVVKAERALVEAVGG